ncbi:SGNH/GDSL hydrolase family protein [Streptomyces sp. LP11]|uniref:SGNH/GDSL hydrolase family protein n=1 Tax=Streptomyces pyxinicus TaxID=2970331 RepID=A0ABT2BCE8_9ACTN|nr:SGNH/GDSL hydrolase family protein [Streptomyces sp. LP11]MCS0606188.1 SGNH/GDSL hydrolase family protein [Streptomyces sp. LP11]
MSGRPARVCRLAAALLAATACQTGPARAGEAPAGLTSRVTGVVTWAASADRLGAGTPGRDYRLIVRTSVGGTGLRVRFTNAFGDRPLTLDAVYAGVRQREARLRPGSNRRLTFGGARTVTVPAGSAAWSDPLPGRLPAGTDLAVSLRTPDAAGPATGHPEARQTSYTGQGADTAQESGAGWTGTTGSWWYADAASVRPDDEGTGAVAVLGDSLTDGRESTSGLDRRWPDYLARRLASAGTRLRGVANEGISSNRLLADGAGQAAVHRLERDVLSQPGVRTVFLFEGVNDIRAHTGVTAAGLIAGYRDIARRAHTAGVCVVAATVGPFRDAPEWDPAAEAVRQDVNRYLRTSGDFDRVTDFDRALRDPHDPERIAPLLDGGDHLHPDDRGMRALADAVDLGGLDCRR